MGILKLKNILKAFKSDDSLLGGILVTNILPGKENFDSQNSEKKLKNVWLMLNDVNSFFLKAKTFFDDPGREIVSCFNKFKNTYNKEYKNIKKCFKKANEMKKDKEKYKKSFNEFSEIIEGTVPKAEKIKQEVCSARALRKNNEKIKKLKIKLLSKNLEIARIEEEWDNKLEEFKNQRKIELTGEYYRKLDEVGRALSEYATKNYIRYKYDTASSMLDDLKNGKYGKKIKFFSEIKENLNFWKRYGLGKMDELFVEWVKNYHPLEYNLLYGKNKKISEANLNFDANGIDVLKKSKEEYENCVVEIESIETECEECVKKGVVLEKNYQELEKFEEQEVMNSIKERDEIILSYQNVYKHYYDCVVEYMRGAASILGCCSVILAALDKFKRDAIITTEDKKSFEKASEYKEIYGNKISVIQLLGALGCVVISVEKEYQKKGEEYNAEREKAIREFEKNFQYKR